MAKEAGIENNDDLNIIEYPKKNIGSKIKQISKKADVDLLIFDNDLSPAQMRNLENKTEMRVLDRSALILDIFSRNARTAEPQLARR